MAINSKITPLDSKTTLPTFFNVSNNYEDIDLEDRVEGLRDMLNHLSEVDKMEPDEVNVCKQIAKKLVKLLTLNDLADLGVLVTDNKGVLQFNQTK